MKCRVAKKLSRADVVDKLGVTHQTVGAWERGDRVPGREHLAALTDLYGMRPTDVVKAVTLSTETEAA